LALQKFDQVASVRLTPQVRFHIALCKSHLGRLNEALGEYRLAEYEAEQGALPEAAEIRAAREELEGRIPRVWIVPREGIVLSRVTLDGVQLGGASLTEPVTIDPGPHRLEAVSADGRRFAQDFSATEREQVSVNIAFESAGASAAQDSPASSASPDHGTAGMTVREGNSGAAPWIVSGVGAAALGASIYSLLAASDAQTEVDKLSAVIGDRCVGAECSEEIRTEALRRKDATDDRNLFTGLGYSGLAVSGLALGAAAYLWISAEPPDAHSQTPLILVTAVPGDAQVLLQGAF
jgi:hypothetical protein